MAHVTWRSAPALTKPGTCRLICTFHAEDNMRMTIVVRH
jgi:plastocyanin